MKSILLKSAMVCFLISVFGGVDIGLSGTVQEVKDGSKAAVKEVKEGAVETGKTFVEAGKKAKEGSKEAWKEIQKGVKEAGADFKKVFKKEKEDDPKENSSKDDK